MVNLTLNGVELQAEEGQTVLEVALANGVKIPTLCYHKELSPYGACRLCLVEIEGRKEKEEKQISSEAYKEAQEIMGKADAEAIRTYAEAYAKDPEFYSFLETLTSYEENLTAGSTLILSTDGEYLKYLKTPGQDSSSDTPDN